jgi:predicted DCC family thiol-disulfide oxidoreductase YuxK
VRLVQALDRHRRVTAVPFQQPGGPEAYGLTVGQCEAAAWAVTPEPVRRRYRGAAAVAVALGVALGTWLPLRFYELSGVRQFQDAAYAWVARNRSKLPGDVPFCEQHPGCCGQTVGDGR